MRNLEEQDEIEFLAQTRKRFKITVKQLSEESHVSFDSTKSILNGRQRPYASQLDALEEALKRLVNLIGKEEKEE